MKANILIILQVKVGNEWWWLYFIYYVAEGLPIFGQIGYF
jgi:hypothetical protein